MLLILTFRRLHSCALARFQTHTHIHSIACFRICRIAANSCMRLVETPMHELDPILKRSSPPLPRDGTAAASIAAALLRLLVDQTLLAPKFIARALGAIPPTWTCPSVPSVPRRTPRCSWSPCYPRWASPRKIRWNAPLAL